MGTRARFLMVGLVWIGSRRDRACRRARGGQGRDAPLARWPEDGPSLTAAVRDGTSSAQVGAEGWLPIEQKDGLPMPLPARCIAFGKRKDSDSCTTITVTKEISFRSISLRPSDCARAIQRHNFKTRLLPLDQPIPGQPW